MTHDTTSRLRMMTPPPAEPLSLSEAKSFLRIDHTLEDALVLTAITAAREAAELHLRQVLITRSYSYELVQLSHVVRLPAGPAQTVEALYAYDRTGNATEVQSTNYRLTLDGHGLVFSHVPKAESFAVEYVAGLAENAAQVPALIKQGMLHHVAVLMEQRGTDAPMPVQSLQCYQPFRRVRL